MKKTMIVVVIAALVAIGSYVVFAKEHTGGMMDSNDMMMQKRMMGKEMMGQQGMMGMHPMSGMMCGSSMVATQDGGVAVLMGYKLLKYDKDLNLVKQVEIKIDWENWQKMMMPHRNMMMGGQSKSK
jgi:hypothetical protein